MIYTDLTPGMVRANYTYDPMKPTDGQVSLLHVVVCADMVNVCVNNY